MRAYLYIGLHLLMIKIRGIYLKAKGNSKSTISTYETDHLSNRQHYDIPTSKEKKSIFSSLQQSVSDLFNSKEEPEVVDESLDDAIEKLK